jgi:hypothetical protein
MSASAFHETMDRCHPGLDPGSIPYMDSRLRGNDQQGMIFTQG